MLSAGMFTSLASEIALRSLGFPSASPPPIRAAIVISLMSFVNIRPRLASMAPFLCLILCHLEWPDIDYSFSYANFRFSLAQRTGAGISHKRAQKAQKNSAERFVLFVAYFFFVGGCFKRGSKAGALLSSDVVLGCWSTWPPSTASPNVNFTLDSNFLYLSYLIISRIRWARPENCRVSTARVYVGNQYIPSICSRYVSKRGKRFSLFFVRMSGTGFPYVLKIRRSLFSHPIWP